MRKTRQTKNKTALNATLSNQDISLYKLDMLNTVAQMLDEKLSEQNDNFNDQFSLLSTLLREGENRVMSILGNTIKEIESRLLNEIDKKFNEFKENGA